MTHIYLNDPKYRFPVFSNLQNQLFFRYSEKKRQKIEKTENFKSPIWPCLQFPITMSAKHVIENCFNSNIYDGEVCSVCTFFSTEEKVVKNSQNRQKQPKLPIFEGLAQFLSYCVHIFHVRGLIFLPHFKIYQINLQSIGQPFTIFLKHFT